MGIDKYKFGQISKLAIRMAVKIVDIDLTEDVQEFIKVNADVTCSEELKKKILEAPKGELLKVSKEIGSFTKILSVEIVTDELLIKELQ
ncbi:Uncharacterised protein [Candidatus Gugararchaeum adminiculabundum]|nr:Uncharacterised protein [Candidatus Gugararchaeum adminiculabundum]